MLCGSGCAATSKEGDDIAVATSSLSATSAIAQEQNTFGAGVIAAGNSHTCALVGNSGVQCWGDNVSGQLGNGLTTGGFQRVFVRDLTSGVQAIAAGASHTCAIVNGGAKCWGQNKHGQLGNGQTGDNVNSLIPADVSELSHGVQAIAGGDLHTCAIVNGAAKCWGNNDFGQLGDGGPSNTDRATPQPVSNILSGVQAIGAGGSHSCAVVGGAALCWGYNGNGQLGNATAGNPIPGDSNVPVQVTGLTSGVQAIATGTLHTCAIVDGGVKCWGDNSSGQLGTGATDVNLRSPAAVPTLASGVQAIAAGASYTCALLSDGTVRCWGNNRSGRLGIDSTMQVVLTPTQVATITNSLNLIVAGSRHACTDSRGTVWCWGDNGSGEIGFNPDDGSISPAPLLVNGLSVSRVPFVPLHVRLESVVLGPPDLTFTTRLGINTTTLTINGVTSPYFVRQDNYAILFASAISLEVGALVTGTSPLILVANNDVSLSGFYDLRGNGASGGPGAAAPGDAGTGGDGAGLRTIDGRRFGAGGGGGGYGTVGAAGGSNTMVAGGARGTSQIAAGPQAILIGGSPGGGGGAQGGHGAGGGGGGALQVSSATSIRVLGTISAGGGGGPGGGTGDTGGGGGGAGGEIILEAPGITVSGILAANGGGGGGGGGAGGGGAPPGTAGATGDASLTPAQGGAAGVPQGTLGGAGATGNGAAVAGQGGNSKDGGGGGGVGRIWLRYRAGTPPALGGSLITPSTGQDPTLP
jgi:alpha-tubulin suppressor-like RCC1 family protein